MNKKTLYGKDARGKVLFGLNKIADAVATTLGPLGRNVLVSQSMVVDYGVHSLPIEVTKDGYKVTTKFDIDDPFEKPGVLMAKECAQKTVTQAGDGTTTTIVLMRAIAAEGIAAVGRRGSNPIELKRSIDTAVDRVVSELKKISIPIKGDVEKIRQIATVSANNDKSIGDIIANAFAKIGDEGIIDIEPSKSVETEIKISDGYKWDKGLISSLFINNKEKQICEFSEPFILFYDKRINHHTQVERALTLVMGAGKPLLIVCEDAAEEGLAFLAMNNIQKRIMCCVVKSPGFGDGKREEMEDMALLTGGSYVSDIRGVDVKEIELENLGRAKKVVIAKDETVIIGGIHDGIQVENMVNELRMNLTQAKNEDEKFPIEKRIARLTGGVAVIQVGANTETEMKERMDRFDDAIRATKAAITEGYTVGAGTFFAKIGSLLTAKSEGERIVLRALKAPLNQIRLNAGIRDKRWWEFWKPKNILDRVIQSEDNFGYNAKSGEIENLLESGIIDPAKVLRCALQNAASSAGMIITSECIICDTM